MNFVEKVIGFVIAISLTGTIVGAVTDLTGVGGALVDTPAGNLLGLAPLIFVAGVIFMLYKGTRK